jgi:hypothetical protein
MTNDLEAWGEILRSRLQPLSARGFEVQAVTWRDIGVAWPHPLKENYPSVVEADSAGIHVNGPSAEGRLVAFRGGWCDLEFWRISPMEDPIDECLEFDDEAGLRVAVERFASLFEALPD